MITFNYIEDYLEVLAGFREISSAGSNPTALSPLNLFASPNAGPIRLARYDVAVIHNMAETTILGNALTDRQLDLATRLVSKYQKQFASVNVNVLPSIQNPVARYPVRIVDRTKRAYIQDNKIIIKFPYNKELVQIASATAKESKGLFKFNYDAKEWHLAITESNVNWTSTLTKFGIDIDPEITALMQAILDCEQQDFKIELTFTGNDTVGITNAEPVLIQYIENNIGLFDSTNLIKLVDFSSYGGYTVSSAIQDNLATVYKPIILELLLNKDCHYVRTDLNSNGAELLTPLMEYANLTNRWPIYVFEPESTDCLRSTLNQLFDSTEICELVDTKLKNQKLDFSKFKCVYFKKIKQIQKLSSTKVPILVSSSAIEHQQIEVLNAEKVIYYTATTYNKEIVKIASKINN